MKSVEITKWLYKNPPQALQTLTIIIIIVLGPAYIKSLAAILVITFVSNLEISIFSHIFSHCIVWHSSLLATIIANCDDHRAQQRVKQAMFFLKKNIYLGLHWFCKSLLCNHTSLKWQGATGLFPFLFHFKVLQINCESRK